MAFTSKKMRLEKNLIDRFANDLNSFPKPLRTKKHASCFSYHQPLLSFLPACVDTRKINLDGCTSTGPNDCNDTKSNWVAFTKKMRLEQNLGHCPR